MINNNKTTTNKYFKKKTNITGKTSVHTSRLNAEVVFSLKYLSKFWRSLDLLLISCEIKLLICQGQSNV